MRQKLIVGANFVWSPMGKLPDIFVSLKIAVLMSFELSLTDRLSAKNVKCAPYLQGVSIFSQFKVGGRFDIHSKGLG